MQINSIQKILCLVFHKGIKNIQVNNNQELLYLSIVVDLKILVPPRHLRSKRVRRRAATASCLLFRGVP